MLLVSKILLASLGLAAAIAAAEPPLPYQDGEGAREAQKSYLEAEREYWHARRQEHREAASRYRERVREARKAEEEAELEYWKHREELERERRKARSEADREHWQHRREIDGEAHDHYRNERDRYYDALERQQEAAAEAFEQERKYLKELHEE